MTDKAISDSASTQKLNLPKSVVKFLFYPIEGVGEQG